MARIRSIKPEYWSDDSVTACSMPARLLFIGLWNFADDAGNLDRSAAQIKARVFPVDRVNCEPLVNELLTHGLLREYSVTGRKYLNIPGFVEHQVINRPSKPSCPAYDDSLNTHGIVSEPSVSTHGVQEGKVQEGRGSEGRRRRPEKTALPEDFGFSEERRTYVTKHLPDANPEGLFEQFTNQAKANGWVYADWHRMFLTYVRNAEPNSGHFAAGRYPRAHVSAPAKPNVANPDGTLNLEAVRGLMR